MRALTRVGLLAALAGALTVGPLGSGVGAAPPADSGTELLVVDSPAAGSTVGGTIELRGWAADPASARGSGVVRVAVYLDGEANTGGRSLGDARYGLARPDVARALGAARFEPSGFTLPLALAPGPHTLYVYAEADAAGAGWSAPLALALDVGQAGGPRIVARSPESQLPPVHCLGVPAPFGVYGIETPQSYGAIYPPDLPWVFGNPWFWLTYGNPDAPAYVDFRDGGVYLNSYFYQPRPARGIPLVC